MAQGIEVPQTNPNAPQFQPPTDLINAYMARRQQGQKMFLGATEDLGSTFNTLHQQKIQNQMAALDAISKLYGAGGRRAVGMYAPSINQAVGTQIVPPSTTQNLPPIQGGQTPISSQQSIPPQGTPPNATVPTVRDQAPSPYIQASLAAGHPDVAGVGGFHAPQPSPEDIQDIQGGGTWGNKLAQSYKDLGDIAIQPLTAQAKQNEIAMNPLNVAEKNANIRAANSKFATPEQGAAIASGSPGAVAGAYGGQGGQAPVEAYNNAAAKVMEKNKTAAGEISKQGPLTTEVKTLTGMFDNVDKNLHAYYTQNRSLGSGNVYKATKGRFGSAEGATVLNQSAPLVAAINKSLTSRFNMGENELLSSTIAPSPNDTPKYAASKMKMLHQLIQAMDQGNKENVSNVIAAMNGNIPQRVQANGR